MSKLHIEEKEVIKINNKEYSVITKISEQSLPKENLIKLVMEYAIKYIEGEQL